MKNSEIKKKVKLLKKGQIVEIDGLLFDAKRLNNDEARTPCLYCNVNRLCKGDIAKVCLELDFLSKSVWVLNF